MGCTWFMATGMNNWITMEGVLSINLDSDRFTAKLLFEADDTEPYTIIDGDISDNGEVSATCKKPDGSVPNYDVIGTIVISNYTDCDVVTIILSDGGTCIGLKVIFSE